MMKKMSFLIGCFILFPFLANAFDCNKPDFGARIEDLNKDGYFVKYLEKWGISYYNYTGPCRMEMHNHVNPVVSYAFIEDQLYAQITNVSDRDGSLEDIRKKMEKLVSKQIGTLPFEVKQEGDWWIYQWYIEKDSLKYKLKINSKTKESKSAFYYEPLRSKLKHINEADDPT